MKTIPRPEYPRPQMVRPTWACLNGTWEFSIDFSDSGKARRMYDTDASFDQTITVPFCPESDLSGIGYKDFMPAVWYRRSVELTEAQLRGRVLLHFGAVDYHAEVYVNGTLCGSHDGGYASFSIDITEAAVPGANTVVVYAQDDTRDRTKPSGKQCPEHASYGCFYTRTTGIWQTVWMECVPSSYIAQIHTTPDVRNEQVQVAVSVIGPCDGIPVKAEITYKGTPVSEKSAVLMETFCKDHAEGHVTLTLPVPDPVLWDLGKGELYDLVLTCGEDQVASYFGMRSIQLKDRKFYLNGRPVYQRLVLDQGFYPDGIYTAPTDEALKNDIVLSMEAGFNGARLHEKVFEERFLYHADCLGYLVWGEYPNWGFDIYDACGLDPFLPEWISVMNRDYSHPAIIGWCPFNEVWDRPDRKLLEKVYDVTKQLDPIRPCIDTSGGFHAVTDIYDVHDYEQEPSVFASHYAAMLEDPSAVHDPFPKEQSYSGEPYFVSEYGGTWWAKDTENNWGYGVRPDSEEEVIRRITGLSRALLDHPGMCALCYTQLTDVEQEQNGIYTYTREKKFSEEGYRKIREALTAPAAIELE